jgi:hypothetical protein
VTSPGSPTTLTRCSECGTPLPQGTACRSLFEEMLALEWHVPGASGDVVHFLAVTSYVLQHPDGMGYRADALWTMRGLVRDVVESSTPLAEVTRRMRESFDGEKKVQRTKHDTIPAWPGVRWSMTVRDVLDGGVHAYRRTVAAWARATLASLEDATGG